MENMHSEPTPPGAEPLPFSTPHSAPVGWLKAGCDREALDAEPDPQPDALPATIDLDLDEIVDAIRSDPAALSELIQRLTPDDVREDGWTPFSRRLFLQVLAETGRVTQACDWCGLSKQSAYALRARDPLFAAGWDAACEIARAPLADALYEKAVDGVTDTITKDGAVVATRHRFDSRLSIAVLHRLDKRCDRAAELGSRHLAAVRNWNEWLGHVGRGEDQAALAILEPPAPPAPPEPAPHSQSSQLPESANPTDEESEDAGIDLSDRYWQDGSGTWMTDFPAPPGFAGYQSGDYGVEEEYERDCTPDEVMLIEATATAMREEQRADDEALRDAWFDMLRRETGHG
jgi:hypothetical protein